MQFYKWGPRLYWSVFYRSGSRLDVWLTIGDAWNEMHFWTKTTFKWSVSTHIFKTHGNLHYWTNTLFLCVQLWSLWSHDARAHHRDPVSNVGGGGQYHQPDRWRLWWLQAGGVGVPGRDHGQQGQCMIEQRTHRWPSTWISWLVSQSSTDSKN